MKKRRFVPARAEEAARHVGIALVIASAVGVFLEPAISYGDAAQAAIVGVALLWFGLTEEKP